MPQATVGALITRMRGHRREVLLTLRNIDPFKGNWCLPGGHIDPNERAADAICREVKEEAGVDFSGRFMGWFEEIFPERAIHNIVLVFEGGAAGEKDALASPAEVAEMRWFSLAEAAALPLAFTHNEIVRRYMSDQGND
jgi:8-oxo-dGTP diphosphatase